MSCVFTIQVKNSRPVRVSELDDLALKPNSDLIQQVLRIVQSTTTTG